MRLPSNEDVAVPWVGSLTCVAFHFPVRLAYLNSQKCEGVEKVPGLAWTSTFPLGSVAAGESEQSYFVVLTIIKGPVDHELFVTE
jgi:hypothetical protein